MFWPFSKFNTLVQTTKLYVKKSNENTPGKWHYACRSAIQRHPSHIKAHSVHSHRPPYKPWRPLTTYVHSHRPPYIPCRSLTTYILTNHHIYLAALTSHAPLDEMLRTVLKTNFRAFYVAKIMETSFTTWKIYKTTQPKSICSFNQF